ncbi:hypothetical protein K438DRAFT_1782642 [Mycena galopus ATCC 62051]|nr:hypothetical protein K438DRAFT_1782642 [Mycena galopus ATCC 62051]
MSTCLSKPSVHRSRRLLDSLDDLVGFLNPLCILHRSESSLTWLLRWNGTSTDSNGQPCICMRCTKTEVIEGRTLCLNCGHIESAHPQPRVLAGSLIRQYRDAGRLTSTSSKSSSGAPRATQAEAEAETSTGLKNKRKSETDTEPGVLSKRKKKAAAVDEKTHCGGENVEVGHIVVLVDGTKGKPSQLTLERTKPPTPVELDSMKKHKLAVMATPQKPLVINTAWTTQQCTNFFGRLFPDLFSHLGRHLPKADPKASPEIQKQLWLAVIKSKQSVALSTEDLPTGASLSTHVKRRGHKGSDRILYIASKIQVPEERYMDWDVETDSEQEEEEPVDFDMLDEDTTPRKPSAKARGKAPAPVKAEKLEPELELPDMRKAAQMRTRLATKTIARKTFDIPNSSDDERPEPIEVSDEEPDFPPAATLLASFGPPSAVSSSSTSPLFGSMDTSPSPPAEAPTVYDSVDFHSLPPSPTENSSGWASTSSLVSISSNAANDPSPFSFDNAASAFSLPSVPATSVGTSAPAWTSSSSIPSTSVSFTAPSWASSTSVASHSTTGSSGAAPPRAMRLLKRKGKALVNPWKRDP